MTADGRRGKPVIHLLPVASSCKKLPSALKCDDAKGVLALVREAVSDRYRVTGNVSLMNAAEEDRRGGRSDDDARVREIERVFSDERIVATVALRGGAWLTRILCSVDFDLLKRRRTPLAIFGFSELTPLINIAARYRCVHAYHDLCPGFLLPGMTEYARRHYRKLGRGKVRKENAPAFARRWARQRFRDEFAGFFGDVASMLQGRGSCRREITGRWIGPRLAGPKKITVVGGNLTTLVTLLPSPFATALAPKGKWLLLEDVRETPDRVDRLLSHLSLSGYLQHYEGLIVGAFRDTSGDATDAVLECLKRHLPRRSPPIVATNDIGHVWPMSPLPLGRPIELLPQRDGRVRLRVPWSAMGIV